MNNKELNQWTEKQSNFSIGLIIEVLNEQIREDMLFVPIELQREIHTSAIFHVLINLVCPKNIESDEDIELYTDVCAEQSEKFDRIVSALKEYRLTDSENESPIAVNQN